jgi:hypothetical protein
LIILPTITIPLSREFFVVVDEGDLTLVSAHRWWLHRSAPGNRTFYASTKIAQKTAFMHRLILSAVTGQEVDHVNRNGLDNRRQNLRLCTRSLNNANVYYEPTIAGYRGVDTHTDTRRKARFRGRIQLHRVKHCGPWRHQAIDAARDHDALAIEHFGEFAVLNFPALVTA